MWSNPLLPPQGSRKMVGNSLPLSGLHRWWDRLAALIGQDPSRHPPGVETLSTRLPAEPLTAGEFDLSTTTEISGLTKTEAEDLLDWLEANGHTGWELCAVHGSGFVVRRP